MEIILKFTEKLKYITLDKITGVYIIDFGKLKYVGSSKDVLKRLISHRSRLRKKNHDYSNLIGEFDEEKVVFRIIPTTYFLELETLITDEYKELNLCVNKRSGNTLRDFEKTRLAKYNTGRVCSELEIERLRSISIGNTRRRKSVILNDSLIFESITSGAEKYGISIGSIGNNLKGVSKTTKVGIWKYYNN